MSLSSIKFLDSEIRLPLRFTMALPFSEDDKRAMSWLCDETRHYGIEGEVGTGGRAIAFKGFVSDMNGDSLPNSPQIVLKVPNIKIDDKFTLEEIKNYLRNLIEGGGREWQLTRGRLRGCIYANPIFDFHTNSFMYLGEFISFPITAQFFLHDSLPLDQYLLKIHQRIEPYKSERGIPFDNWHGMNDPSEWIKLAKSIAIGLADIHERRVVHGDIWPPNIFIRIDESGNPDLLPK